MDDETLAGELAAFLSEPALTSGSSAAARFCLDVWSGSAATGHRFNVVDEWGLLDDSHREPMLAWLKDPFFP